MGNRFRTGSRQRRRLEEPHKRQGTFHRLRQSSIDEELFDVISGFEALTGPQRRADNFA
jgi:hypothetical protein